MALLFRFTAFPVFAVDGLKTSRCFFPFSYFFLLTVWSFWIRVWKTTLSSELILENFAFKIYVNYITIFIGVEDR